MSPRRVTDPLVRPTPLLSTEDTIEAAVPRLLETDLPALPVVDAEQRRVAQDRVADGSWAQDGLLTGT